MASAGQHIKNLNNILENRGKEWPLRGKYWLLFNEESEKFYQYLIHNPDFNPSNKNKDILKSFYKIENKAVFICGNLKSGTTLLSQLLDNHKNIFSLPGDSFFIKKFNNMRAENINEIGLYWLRRLLNPTGQHPFLPYGTSADIYQNFINYLHFLILKEKKDVFKAIVLSFAAATRGKNNSELQYWSEKTPLNELYAKKLHALFPEAKFLNITRNPVQNIISLQRLDKFRNRKSNMLQKTLFQIFLIKQSEKNEKNIKNYKLIPYEKLIEDPIQHMKSTASFLQIDFSETLLKPTVNGVPASSNSMYSQKRFTGKIIKNANDKEKLNELNSKEKRIIVNILSLHKPYKIMIKKEYPELLKYFNLLYYLSAKMSFFLYKIYRKFFK